MHISPFAAIISNVVPTPQVDQGLQWDVLIGLLCSFPDGKTRRSSQLMEGIEHIVDRLARKHSLDVNRQISVVRLENLYKPCKLKTRGFRGRMNGLTSPAVTPIQL